jgi:sugar phosphate isomerase/epimerase
MSISRRHFGKMAAAAVPAVRALGPASFLAQGLWAQGGGRGRPIAKPNSRFAGVQIGVISYSFNSIPTMDLIPTIAKLGINEVELMSNHAETLVGAPTAPPRAPAGGAGAGGGGRGGAGGGGGRGGAAAAGGPPQQAPLVAYYSGEACAGRAAPQAGGASGGRAPAQVSPEQQAAQDKFRQDQAQWRTSEAAMNKYRDLRKQFDDAGINLGILCYNMNGNIADDEIDYAFRMAAAMGVRSISSSSTVTIAKRVAPFADKYKMTWAGHGHDDVCDPEQFAKPETFEKIMGFSPYIGVNLDIGHFTAAGYDAVPFIRRHYDRITNLHLKDRFRNSQNGGRGANVRWGDGETPIREVLQLLRREQYPFPANIEYEYQGTDAVIEVAKCLQFAKDILVG